MHGPPVPNLTDIQDVLSNVPENTTIFLTNHCYSHRTLHTATNPQGPGCPSLIAVSLSSSYWWHSSYTVAVPPLPQPSNSLQNNRVQVQWPCHSILPSAKRGPIPSQNTSHCSSPYLTTSVQAPFSLYLPAFSHYSPHRLLYSITHSQITHFKSTNVHSHFSIQKS